MKVIWLGIVSLTLAGIGAGLTASALGAGNTATGAATAVTDTFTRTLTHGWGNAAVGGSYTLVGDAGDFGVADSTGNVVLANKKREAAYLGQVAIRDANATVRIRTNKAATGGAQFVYVLVRRTNAGDEYVGRIRITPNHAVHVMAGKEIGGKTTWLGKEMTVPQVTQSAGKFLEVRLRANGTNPTMLRMRVWADGQTEPAQWQYSAQDASAALQNAGGVGLRVGAGRKTTDFPVKFSFDDFAVSDGKAATQANREIYWGALVMGQAPSPQNMQANGVFDTFEKNAQKKMSILHWGQPWKMRNAYQTFQTSYFTDVRAHGSIPLIDWGSFAVEDGINQPNFQLKDIYGGTYDAYIAQWAKAAKAWGHPFFLRLDWEMNGNWQFPWSEQLNGNQAGDYIKMWQHVHDIFTQNGVTNVTWVWCPNVAGPTTLPLSKVFPGDGYVDWTCLDGYNKYSTWLDFDQVFAAKGINWLFNSYKEITTLAPSKPLMIGEVASLEAKDGGAKKAAWIREAFLTQLPQTFPKIRAVVWFNWDDGNAANTFPIESSNVARDAFAAGIGASYYAVNRFANIETSPIPPLP